MGAGGYIAAASDDPAFIRAAVQRDNHAGVIDRHGFIITHLPADLVHIQRIILATADIEQRQVEGFSAATERIDFKLHRGDGRWIRRPEKRDAETRFITG